MDLCGRIVERLKSDLKLAKLDVKLNPVTSATRIPLMANGTIDLECGSTTNNLERQKQVSFTITHFVTANRFVSKKSANLKTVDDLKGKTVVSTSGTTNIKQITEIGAQKGLNLNILAAKDHAEAFLMVETGRAAAFVMDDILLSSLVAASKSPQDYVISADALSVEPYGIMLRRDDAPFKKVVDEAMIATYRSGAINPIYDKWFLKPIPPKGTQPQCADERRVQEGDRQSDRQRRPGGVLIAGGTRRRSSHRMTVIGSSAVITDRSRPLPAGGRVNYNWNWGIFFQLSPDGVHTYLGTLLIGTGWTLATALSAWCLALAMGSPRRRHPHHAPPWLVRLGNAYVELFRNIPLLVQMFLWYFVLPELLPTARRLAQAASERLVLHRRGRARLLHLGARRRAGARRHHEPRPRPAHGRARARAHAAADLRLRAAADGLSHHPAAADVGISQHHQEQRGRAHHRADGAHGARPRHAGIHLPGVRGVHRGDRHLPPDQHRRDLRHALDRAPLAVPGFIGAAPAAAATH